MTFEREQILQSGLFLLHSGLNCTLNDIKHSMGYFLQIPRFWSVVLSTLLSASPSVVHIPHSLLVMQLSIAHKQAVTVDLDIETTIYNKHSSTDLFTRYLRLLVNYAFLSKLILKTCRQARGSSVINTAIGKYDGSISHTLHLYLLFLSMY